MANKPKPQRAPGSESPLGDMDADTFRRHGQRALDWIAEYLDHSDRYPVMARVRPGDVRAALPAAHSALCRARSASRHAEEQ